MPDFPAALFGQRHIAELTERSPLRFFPRDAAIHQVGDLLFERFVYRLGEFAVLPIAKDNLFEAFHHRVLSFAPRGPDGVILDDGKRCRRSPIDSEGS